MDPPPLKPSESSPGEMWIGFTVTWLIAVGLGWLIARAIDRRRERGSVMQSGATADPTEIMPHDTEFMTHESSFWNVPTQGSIGSPQNDLGIVTPEPTVLPVPNTSSAAKPERPSRSGSISRLVQDVRTEWAAIQAEKMTRAPALPPPAKPAMSWGVVSTGFDQDDTPSTENEDFYSGDDEGEWGAILRRGTDGRPLSFEYVKKHGEVSTRTLVDWVEYPRHVQGVCADAGAVLCFRKDRVSEWHASSEKMLRAPKGKSRR